MASHCHATLVRACAIFGISFCRMCFSTPLGDGVLPRRETCMELTRTRNGPYDAFCRHAEFTVPSKPSWKRAVIYRGKCWCRSLVVSCANPSRTRGIAVAWVCEQSGCSADSDSRKSSRGVPSGLDAARGGRIARLHQQASRRRLSRWLACIVSSHCGTVRANGFDGPVYTESE